MVGVLICISYQIEGSDNPKCGSLHNIGAPLLVFLPLKAQLLLPFAGLGLLISLAFTIVSLPKYNESAVAGFTGTIPGTLNAVPFGMMGIDESDNCGYNIFICSSPSTDF